MLTESRYGRLVRVLKNIKRKKSDGSVVSHQQAFHVRKAAPGDRYAQTRESEPSQMPAASVPVAMTNEPPPAENVQDTPVDLRVEVHPIEIPWDLKLDASPGEGVDPVPPEIRRRFDPANRAQRVVNPINTHSLFCVKPGEDMLWGSVEAELINRLRLGTVVAAKPLGAGGHAFLAKVEATDGIVERAYLRFDALENEQVSELYSDIYDLADEAKVSLKAAAAYELAKGIGMDDLVPPTVCRFDLHGGLEPILSSGAESEVASALGVSPEAVSAKIGKHASLELWTDGSSMLWEQPWFASMVDPGSESLNNFFDSLPEEVHVGLVRGAILDYVLWTGNRTWSDLVFCPGSRHPVHFLSNGLSFPNPMAIGVAYMDYKRAYADACPSSLQYMPLLWSDVVSSVVLRGYDAQVELYDKIAADCVRRMRGDRAVETIRALAGHGVSALSIAGLLARLAFLRYGANVVMRNPLVVAEYYYSLVTGDVFDPGFDIDLEAMEADISEMVSKVSYIDFSFADEMRKPHDEG